MSLFFGQSHDHNRIASMFAYFLRESILEYHWIEAGKIDGGTRYFHFFPPKSQLPYATIQKKQNPL